jgi:hypothetical protein
VKKDGAVQAKASGDGDGASSAYLINGSQVSLRAVAKKGGTFDIYVANGAALPTTVYQTYENVDFNGYLGFFTSENESLIADGTHGDLSLVDVNVNVNTDAIVYDYTATMAAGAGVRTVAPYGLRFKMEMTKADYNFLQNGVKSGLYKSVTFGMYILPYEYAQANAMTEENLYGESRVYGWEDEADKTQILRLEDTELNIDGTTAYLYGAIVNIKTANLERLFVGVGFIEVELADGTKEVTLCVGYQAEDTGATETNNIRSVYGVAKAAYADTSADAPSADVKAWLKENYIDPVEN